MEKESERQQEQEQEDKKVCKRCHQNYTPSSNTPSSCRFHPSFFVCRRHDDQKRYTTLPRTLSIWIFHDVFAYPFLKFHCFFGYMDCFSCSFQYPCADLDYLLDMIYDWELEAFASFGFWVFVLFICWDLWRSYSLGIYFVHGKTLHSNFHAQISG